LIAHAIQTRQGEATFKEICNWIKKSYSFYNKLPQKYFESCVLACITDDTCFVSKKDDGWWKDETERCWNIDVQTWKKLNTAI
jgi:hypothetical protein